MFPALAPVNNSRRFLGHVLTQHHGTSRVRPQARVLMLSCIHASATCAFLIVAQPHSSSESLMLAMGRLLPRPKGYQSWYAFKPIGNATEVRFWTGWPHSDKGSLAISQLEWMCGPSVSLLRSSNESRGSEGFRKLAVLKNHILPLPENQLSLERAIDSFAARGAFLFRDVDSSVDAACRRYGWAGQPERLLTLYRQTERFVSEWRRWVSVQRARGHRIVVVEFEDLISDSRAELAKLASAWRLDDYLQHAKRTVTSTAWLWERTLAQRRSVLDDVAAMGLPWENARNYTAEQRDTCREATRRVSRRARHSSSEAPRAAPQDERIIALGGSGGGGASWSQAIFFWSYLMLLWNTLARVASVGQLMLSHF